MKQHDFIGFPEVKIFLDPNLPSDEEEPTGDLNFLGHFTYLKTGKKIHAFFNKETQTMRVSQEYLDCLIKHFEKKDNPLSK